MNSPPEPGSPSPTTPSSGSPPPEEVQFPSGDTQDPDTDISRFSASQSSKKTTGTGFLSGLQLWKKDDATVSVGGKAARRAPLVATSTWVEGTQRGMKEELVDQAVADQLKRSKQSSSLLSCLTNLGPSRRIQRSV